jgi:hypothetical protein
MGISSNLNYEAGSAGHDWLKYINFFLRRNPELSGRHTKSLSLARA